MACGVVSVLSVPAPSLPHRKPIGKFQGDADDLVDKLIAACQIPSRPAGQPGAWGRELTPYFEASAPVPSPDDSDRNNRSPASASRRKAARSGKSSRSASPGQRSRSRKPAEGCEKPRSVESFSTGFLSPKPEALPIPSFI